jgi:TusA-related sulfurtransferase
MADIYLPDAGAQALFLQLARTAQSRLAMAEDTLDISADMCPMTLVKTKLRLEELAVGDLLTIHVADGEARLNVPRSLREYGHTVLAEHPVDGGGWAVVVRKTRD